MNILQISEYQDQEFIFRTLVQGYVDYYFTSADPPQISYAYRPYNTTALVSHNNIGLAISAYFDNQKVYLTSEISVLITSTKQDELNQIKRLTMQKYEISRGVLYFDLSQSYDCQFTLSDKFTGIQPMHFLEKVIFDYYSVYSYFIHGSIMVEPISYKYLQSSIFHSSDYHVFNHNNIALGVNSFFASMDLEFFKKLDNQTKFVFDKYGLFHGINIIAPPSTFVFYKYEIYDKVMGRMDIVNYWSTCF